MTLLAVRKPAFAKDMVKTKKRAPARGRRTAKRTVRPPRSRRAGDGGKARVKAGRRRRPRNFTYGRGVLALFLAAAVSVWLMTSLLFARTAPPLSPLAALAAGRLAAGGREVLSAVCADFSVSFRARFETDKTGEAVVLRPWIRRLAESGSEAAPESALPPARLVDGPSDWVRSVEGNNAPPRQDGTRVAADPDYPRLPIEGTSIKDQIH